MGTDNIGAALVTVGEAARALRVHQSTVSRWVAAGKMQAIRLPSGRLRIRREDVERLLEPEVFKD